MFHGFHGRTYAALSATAQPKYHVGFEPIVPGFQYVPFGDLDAVEKAVDSQTAAVMLEPIQGEGGINIPPDNYLAGLREICDRTGALLIFDEVQTGMGRTGKWFAHQHFGVTPDIMTVAKALASGVAAGVMMATHPVAEVLKPGMHASTYGGNPIACRAGLATIETIESEGLLESAKILEAKFRSFFEGLQAKRPDLIRAIRIRGVMVGVELSCDASPIVAECMNRQLLINATQGNVIRLLPALNLTEELLEEGCSILSDILLSYRPTEGSQP
jgi:acetylornithine/succinyldiaminopimelate/putrescine aminotransferase